MPNDDAGEKSELPTPRKLENARKEGQVAISTEVNTALLLLVGFSGLVFLGPPLFAGMSRSLTAGLGDHLSLDLTDRDTLRLFWEQQSGLLLTLLGFLGLAFLTALIAGFSQVGLNLTLKPLEPKWSRISPLAGLKRLFGLRGMMRFVFSLVKLILIVAMAWYVLRHDIAVNIGMSIDLEARTADTAWMLLLLGFKLAALLAIIALLDFLYQRYQHQRDLMMSKQEVKDEMKQSEGDPLVKAKIRQIQRQMAQNRMMQEVPKADVVITNPTHVAVALQYDPKTMGAPVVIAKGYDRIAQRIKKIASEHGIVQVENVPLARGLAKACEIGHAVPVDFYQGVAEVLSYVYRLKNPQPAAAQP